MPSAHAPPAAMIRLPAGRFTLGNPQGRRDERPAREISLDPFLAARCPVSNREYREFVQDAGAPAPPFWNDDRFSIDDAPVVGISWHDAAAYCEWRARIDGLPCRLPTEAEREYAARGGLPSADWPSEAADWPDDPARTEIARLDRPHVPSELCANGFGLLCMADNVHEWCSDWYARDAYARLPAANPRGPADGARRSSRGGSWRHRIKFTRVSARSSLPPAYRYNDYGFRLYADA